MDKVMTYRKILQELLTEYASYLSGSPLIEANSASAGDTLGDDLFEVQTVFDTERDHYQLVHLGFHAGERQYAVLVHFDIKNGKIWLQANNTDVLFVQDLLSRGVPKEDVVLGIHAPALRPYAAFAVA